jgi:hypothetical protein
MKPGGIVFVQAKIASKQEKRRNNAGHGRLIYVVKGSPNAQSFL